MLRIARVIIALLLLTAAGLAGCNSHNKPYLLPHHRL